MGAVVGTIASVGAVDGRGVVEGLIVGISSTVGEAVLATGDSVGGSTGDVEGGSTGSTGAGVMGLVDGDGEGTFDG